MTPTYVWVLVAHVLLSNGMSARQLIMHPVYVVEKECIEDRDFLRKQSQTDNFYCEQMTLVPAK